MFRVCGLLPVSRNPSVQGLASRDIYIYLYVYVYIYIFIELLHIKSGIMAPGTVDFGNCAVCLVADNARLRPSAAKPVYMFIIVHIYIHTNLYVISWSTKTKTFI